MLVGTLEPRMRQWREYNAEGWPRQQDRRISPLVPRRADAPPSWLLLLNKPNGVAATDGAKTFIFLAFGEVRGGNGRQRTVTDGNGLLKNLHFLCIWGGQGR